MIGVIVVAGLTMFQVGAYILILVFLIGKSNGGRGMTTETIKCPYCGHEMKVDVPEPQERTFQQIERYCSNCDMKVIIPILPKFNARPIE